MGVKSYLRNKKTSCPDPAGDLLLGAFNDSSYLLRPGEERTVKNIWGLEGAGSAGPLVPFYFSAGELAPGSERSKLLSRGEGDASRLFSPPESFW